MDRKNKIVIIITVIIILILIVLALLFKNKNASGGININELTVLEDNEDADVRDIYHQFNPEEDILFNILGSGDNKDNYGYYYKNDIVTYKDLSDAITSYITLHSIDYITFPINEERSCHSITLERIGVTYGKIFNSDREFKFEVLDDDNTRIEIDNDNVCIFDIGVNSNYKYTLDTYFIKNEYKDNLLYIYEKVAFIKVDGNNLEFYSDYNMKDKIYTIDSNKADTSFINNTNMVSNVLVKYSDKFNTYKYTFEKDNEHYHFQSVSLVEE